MMRDISPTDCMDLIRFFFIDIFVTSKVSVVVVYRLPMMRDISPTASMDLIRFFFMDIFNTSKSECVEFLQGADDVQHFADGSHGLGQILHGVVLHNIYPPNEW